MSPVSVLSSLPSTSRNASPLGGLSQGTGFSTRLDRSFRLGYTLTRLLHRPDFSFSRGGGLGAGDQRYASSSSGSEGAGAVVEPRTPAPAATDSNKNPNQNSYNHAHQITVKVNTVWLPSGSSSGERFRGATYQVPFSTSISNLRRMVTKDLDIYDAGKSFKVILRVVYISANLSQAFIPSFACLAMWSGTRGSTAPATVT